MKYDKGTFIIYNDHGFEFGRISSHQDNHEWCTVYNPKSRTYPTVFERDILHTYPADMFPSAKAALTWWDTCNRFAEVYMRSEVFMGTNGKLRTQVTLRNVPGLEGTIIYKDYYESE